MAEPGVLQNDIAAVAPTVAPEPVDRDPAETGRRALGFLARHGLVATPDAYALAHAYVSANPPALTLAVDAFERAGRHLDAEDVTRFSELFLAPDAASRPVETGIDPLTELPDRAAFEAQLAAAVREAEHQGRPLCVLMVEIDRLDRIEARHGRAMGEEVLRALARAFETALQGLGRVARYGDHAFAVLLPRMNLRQTVAVGEHIRRLVARRAVIDRESGETLGRLTLSAGAVTLRKGDTARALLLRSGSCLEDARAASGNRVVAETDADEILLPRRTA